MPDWLGTAVLAVLASVMPGKMAMAAMMTLVSAGLLAGLYSCAAGLSDAKWSRQQRSQVLLILTPLAICEFLTLGFWGFLISSALCFHVMGKLLRGGTRADLNRQVRIAVMLALAYWAHPLPVMLSGVFQGYLFVIEQWQASGGQITSWKDTLTKFAEAVWPWLLPSGLCVWFAVRLISLEVAPIGVPSMTVFRNRLLDLVHMNGLLDMSPTPTSGGVFVLLLGVLSAGAALTRGRLYPPAKSISTFTLILVVAYVLVPDTVGSGSSIAIRILFNLVAFVTLLALSPGGMEAGHLALCSLLAAVCVLSFGGEYLLVSKRLGPALGRCGSGGRWRYSGIRVAGSASV